LSGQKARRYWLSGVRGAEKHAWKLAGNSYRDFARHSASVTGTDALSGVAG